jgi:hypothetical protein
VASSAAFMTGGGNLPAMGALLLLTGLRPEPVAMVAWLAAIAMLGVFTAVVVSQVGLGPGWVVLAIPRS